MIQFTGTIKKAELLDNGEIMVDIEMENGVKVGHIVLQLSAVTVDDEKFFTSRNLRIRIDEQ